MNITASVATDSNRSLWGVRTSTLTLSLRAQWTESWPTHCLWRCVLHWSAFVGLQGCVWCLLSFCPLCPLKRSSRASFCLIRKSARMWRSTCLVSRWTPRGKRSRPRHRRATLSTPSGTRRPLSSRRSGPQLSEPQRNEYVSEGLKSQRIQRKRAAPLRAFLFSLWR